MNHPAPPNPRIDKPPAIEHRGIPFTWRDAAFVGLFGVVLPLLTSAGWY